MNRRITTIAGSLAAGAGLGVLGVAAYTGRNLNEPRRPWPDYAFTPFELGAPATDVRFTSEDGVPLAGWWFETPGSPLVIVCAHGHRGSKSDMLGIGTGLWRAGHTVLLFDTRGNGESGDGPQSLSHYERRDLRAAIDLAAARRPDARIAVVGFSMGAATAILEAAGDPRVEALVLDSPFATMRDVVANGYRRHRLPARPTLPVAALVNRLRYGYAYGEVRPLDAADRLAGRPVLLLHGTADRVIPFAHAEQIAARIGETCTLVPFGGVDHCGAYFEDRPAYVARVDEFLSRSLGASTGGRDD